MVSGTLNTSGSTNIKELASSLYKSHYQLLMRYGKQVSQNEELVKDAIQDLFLTLCGQEGVLRGIHNPQTYLCRSLRRIMLRQLRKEKNMYERDGLWAAESNLYDESDHAMADEVLLKSNKYATRAWATAGLPSISRNRLRKVEQAMGSLTARQVETVFLKYYEGLANEEIAGVLDIASQSVCNLLSEALSRLRKQISQHYDAKRYTSIVPVRVRQTG